jgi:uncharacterized surface protein with fasciclin (FAS1) repeats
MTTISRLSCPAALAATLALAVGAPAFARGPVPDPAVKDFQRLVDAAYAKYKGLQDGKNADYIPILTETPSDLFGVVIVTKDGKVTVDGASVIATDVMGTNGVIHVIDTVVLPKPNLVETAANAKSFTTLLAAAQAAGLAETLATGGTFTVFAPTDEAFAKLGKETIESLLKPENKEKLASILKHHVVAGSVMAAQAVGLTEAKTIGETTLSLSYDKKTKVLTVGGAKVVSADVVAGNGVIHVVDSVILPSKN